MSDKLLNENCIFQCNQCVEGIPFKAKELFPTNVTVNGSPALTNSVHISSTAPGTCRLRPNLAGTPPYLPCTVQVIKWNSCSRSSADNRNLLTDKSIGKCVMPGGEISVSIAATAFCVQSEKKQKQLQAHEFTLSEDETSDTRKKSNDRSGDDTVSQKNSEADHDPVSDSGSTKAQDGQATEAANIDRTMMKCPYSSDKEKCKSCKYADSPTDRVLSAQMEESSKTPSQILRDNYRKHYNEVVASRKYYKDSYNSYEDEIRLFSDHLAGNEAHHIISTNDVLMQSSARFVLQLVNFYDFNINDAYNCILLAGNGDRGAFGSFTETKKLEEKFRVMNQVKRQWHGGGHRFTVNDESFEGDYATKVTQLLVQVMNGLPEEKCRIDEDYYEQGKAEFEKKMWAVVDHVRKHLVMFERGSKKSRPYYVSEAAYLFSVNGRRKVNFAVITGDENNTFTVYKYTALRKEGNTDVLQYDPKGERWIDAASGTEIRRLILFLGKINIALIDQSRGEVRIPFSIDHQINVSMGGMPPQEFLKKASNSLVVSFFDIEETDEEKQIMMKRLQEAKERSI